VHGRGIRHAGGYRLRRATVFDLPALARLEAVVFPEPTSLTAWYRRWVSGAVRVLLACQGPELAAFFAFELQGPTAHVLANATAGAHRRRGLATALLLAGEVAARRDGARWLLGEVRRSNEVQLHLLHNLQWRVIGVAPRFFGDGEDAVVVWRPLL